MSIWCPEAPAEFLQTNPTQNGIEEWVPLPAAPAPPGSEVMAAFTLLHMLQIRGVPLGTRTVVPTEGCALAPEGSWEALGNAPHDHPSTSSTDENRG